MMGVVCVRLVRLHMSARSGAGELCVCVCEFVRVLLPALCKFFKVQPPVARSTHLTVATQSAMPLSCISHLFIVVGGGVDCADLADDDDALRSRARSVCTRPA